MDQLVKKVQRFAKTPQGFFVVCAAAFGVLFLLAIPPLQTPDEAAHFLRAYEISEGKLVAQNVHSVTGDYLPSSIQKTIDTLSKDGPIQFNGSKKYNLHETKAALSIPLNQDSRQYYDISASASYSPVAYVPQVIGVLIGKIVHAPVVVMLYLARLCNLIAWIGIGFLAIKLFPWKKWAIAGIALLPMMVAQSISPGIDVISIGLGVLFFAYIFSLRTSGKVLTAKQLLLLLLVAVGMVLSKQIMVVFLPLVFMLKKEQFTLRKYYWLYIALSIFVPILLFAIWSVLSGHVSQSSGQLQNGQNTAEQVTYLLHRPWHVLAVLFNTFFFSWGDGVWTSLIGNFGWVDTPLSGLFIDLGVVGLAFYLFANYEPGAHTLSKRWRWLLAGLAITYVVLVCVAMYVLYSPLKASIVIGVQGRYLLPALFLLVYALLTGAIKVQKALFVRFTVLFSTGMLVVSLLTIIFRYYISYTI